MIRLTLPPNLAPRERFGLEALVDLSRLLVLADSGGGADVTRLEITDDPASLDSLLQQGLPLDRGDGVVRITRHACSAVTDLAGAAVEQGSAAEDRHGRVPSAENPLVRAGREREPVVQHWAAALAAAVQQAAGRRSVRFLAPWPEGRRWAAAITHDLDIVSGWPLFTALRAVELARGREWARLARSLGAAARAIGRRPVQAGVQSILDAERAAGIHSTWFVLCGTPTPSTWLAGDVTYSLESAAGRRLLDLIRRDGHEIGLHGSFRSALDGARMREERERLGRALGGSTPPAGVRQHFLRMRPGQTQTHARAAGFSYDATFGFPDRNGFRIGVADILPAWGSDAAGSLDIAPLVWMDRALSKYRGIEDPDAWIGDGLELAAAARDARGLWVGLWHPNLTPPLGFPGAPEAFRRLLQALSADGPPPWFATLERLVSWRRTRRDVRATHVAPDGRVEIATTTRADWRVLLEDAQGRAVGTD